MSFTFPPYAGNNHCFQPSRFTSMDTEEDGAVLGHTDADRSGMDTGMDGYVHRTDLAVERSKSVFKINVRTTRTPYAGDKCLPLSPTDKAIGESQPDAPTHPTATWSPSRVDPSIIADLFNQKDSISPMLRRLDRPAPLPRVPLFSAPAPAPRSSLGEDYLFTQEIPRPSALDSSIYPSTLADLFEASIERQKESDERAARAAFAKILGSL